MSIKKIITGLSVQQEYGCIDLLKFNTGLSVYLGVPNSSYSLDVTKNHLFLGYKPLIIGLVFPHDVTNSSVIYENQIHLHFKASDDKTLATLTLRRISQEIYGESTLVIYEGIRGTHKFLSGLHQFINRFRDSRKVRATGNVDLTGNLYDQVRIAYAIPRIIAVITVQDGKLMNMFPTDLHGPINDTHYIGSLRIGGMANEQVEQHKKIVLSLVNASGFKEVYGLGKNHMQPVQPPENFQTSEERSSVFSIPLPAMMNAYYELELDSSADIGIHRLHVYRIVNRYRNPDSSSCLSHVHQYYIQWREDHSLPLQILKR
ncbi:MAG TPA: hypothetical protein VGK59_09280 [Ohtaekwangia sp.]